MNRSLLNFYEDELNYLKNSAKEFSSKHPALAGKLGFQNGETDDPHIERLIQSVALLNARTEQQLHDDMPRSVQSLLNILYPHYQKPIPSMAVIQFPVDAKQDNPIHIPSHSHLKMGSNEDTSNNAIFTTAYPTTLWPIKISNATLKTHYPTDENFNKNSIASELHLTLNCINPDLSFSELSPKSLRVFLKGDNKITHALYGLLSENIAYIDIQDKNKKISSSRNITIKPIGFGKDEAILPSNSKQYNPYQLLTEYFSFPEKFLFFDIDGLDDTDLEVATNELTIILYLKKFPHGIQHHINASHFVLGCTPIVNLFKEVTEPMTLESLKTEYPLLPRAQQNQSKEEIYEIRTVTAISPYNNRINYQPFYGLTHGGHHKKNYWYHYKKDHDTYLTLTHEDSKKFLNHDWTLQVNTLCTNGDLPRTLYFKNNITSLKMTEGIYFKKEILWISAPTPSLTAPMDHDNQWRLVSHLTSQHLGLAIEDGSALKEILSLYQFDHHPDRERYIESIKGVRTRRIQRCLPDDPLNLLCQGLEIKIDLNISQSDYNSIILFGTILDHFLATYATLNHFTQLVFTTNHFEEEIRRWKPRIGNKALI